MKKKKTKRLYTVSDLFGDLINGQEVFFIQDAVSKGITKAPRKEQNTHTSKYQQKPLIRLQTTKHILYFVCSKLFSLSFSDILEV